MASRNVKVVAIAEARVMGKLPVLVLSLALSAASLGQIADVPASKAIGEFGGTALDYVWVACLLLSTTFVAGSWFIRDNGRSAIIEIGGIALLVLGLATYAAALWSLPGGLTNRLIIFALVGSSILNTTGRAALLWRRVVWVERVVP